MIQRNVIGIDVFGLERRLLRQILRDNRINRIRRFVRQQQLPAKDTIRRQLQANISILWLNIVRS
ncbi:hypothetical protein GALL_543770 [mine drainage metagenome]|uniref:Uncharacterized protein n=1 Tax=mine drainage metagenome TaxID=410659 RepID=A0A1J5PKL9_9ZZZZ